MTRPNLVLGAGKFCAMIVACSGILSGQSNPVGTLSGTVVGPDRRPLAGAMVRVDTGRGTKEAHSDDKGRFTFPQLLPGSVKLRITAPNMQTFRTQATVIANQTTALAIPLASITSATVEVIGTSTREAGVDANVAVSGKNLTFEELNSLPSIGNIYDAFMATVPGTPSGGYSFHGAEDSANGFTVNGVESRSSLGGMQMLILNRDLIEQVSVLTSGVSSKFGRFVGANVATVTKSGTNEFTGSLRHDLTSNSWNALPRASVFVTSERVPREVTDSQSYTFLGPFIKDKLFFALGYQVTTPSQTTMVTGRVRSGLFAPYTFFSTSENELKDARLDWQVNNDHRLSASWNHYVSSRSGPAWGSGLSTLATGSGPSRQEIGFKSLGYAGILAPNVTVDAIYSETLNKSGGKGTGSPGGKGVVTWVDRMGAGSGDLYENGTTTDAVGQEKIRTVGVNVTWAASGHYVETGFQYYASRIERVGSYDDMGNAVTPSHAEIWFAGWQGSPASMDRHYRLLKVGDTSTSRLITFDPLSGGCDSKVWGLYVNDVWSLDGHWTFNLGARFDSNHFTTSPEGDHYTVSTAVPRLSAAYDLQGDHRHTFTLGAAEYAGQISSGTFTSISVANQSRSNHYAYFGAGNGSDALNGDGTINWDVWGRSSSELGKANPFLLSGVTRMAKVDGGIKPPRSRELTLSYRFAGQKDSLTATLLHNILDNYVGMKRLGASGLGVNNAPKLYWNDDGMRTRYNGLEIQYQRQVTEDFSAGGNLTWSGTRGTPGGRNQYGDTVPNDLVAPSGPQANQWSGATTPLMLHGEVTYRHGFGKFGKVMATLQGNYWSKSFAGYRSFSGPTSDEIQDQGYSDTIYRYYADAETWWPEQYSFNLHLGYEVTAYGKVVAFVSLDVLNLFNHLMPRYVNFQTALTDGTTTYAPGDTLPANWYLNPSLRAVGYSEPNPDNNPWILKDGQVGDYTEPRKIQVRFGLRF